MKRASRRLFAALLLCGFGVGCSPERLPTVSRSDSPTLSAELRDVVFVRPELRKCPSYIGEIHNTGSVAITNPSARFTLIYPEGGRGEEAFCNTILIGALEPGEKVPCIVDFHRSALGTGAIPRVELLPLEPAKGRRPKLTVVDAVLIPPTRTWFPGVSGHVRNDSGRDLKGARVVVSLYGRDGRIVGGRSALVNYKATGALSAGATGEFTAWVEEHTGTPVTFAVLTTARELVP
jgi:hypothetical protein